MRLNKSRLTTVGGWRSIGRRNSAFDEAMRHPRKDELIRSIGYDATVEVDLGLYLNGINEPEEAARKAQGLQLLPGDKILICSDGLIKKIKPTNKHYVEESEIVPIINDSKPEESANNLVKKALERGANDNVSAIVLEIPGSRPKISIKKVARYALPILVALVVIVLLSWARLTGMRVTRTATNSDRIRADINCR